MNLRSQAILLALKCVSSVFETEPLHVLEVGSMFKEDEGLSTFLIAEFLHKRTSGGHFVSIDYDLDHIEACRKLIAARNPALCSRVELRHGHSVSLLPEILDNFQTLHFALLDGGAHPEVCLVEFEQAIAYLANKGVVLVDDAHPLHPSPSYGLPRPFGKATLILPMLILAHYVQNRAAVRRANSALGDEVSVPDSRFVRQLLDLKYRERELPFGLIGDGHKKHKMLICGNAEVVAEAEQWLKCSDNDTAPSVPMMRRMVKRFLRIGKRQFLSAP
jgi:predicted O-methyltransferase YrrM